MSGCYGSTTSPCPCPGCCTDPQPIPVRTGSEAVAVFCAVCRYRTPVVADRRTARQEFDRAHGATT